jgi:hypothetical protein
MNCLIITFKSNLPTTNFSIRLNGTEVDYQTTADQIIINTLATFGVNLLDITNNQPTVDPIIITDMLINDTSLRQTLYLAYSELAGEKFCNTWLTDRCPSITIPFGNPVALWLVECAKKIPNTVYGTNLFEKYDVYYPQSVIVSDSFPTLMQDFMKYDFGFTLVDKSQPKLGNKDVPWIKINFDYDELALLSEFNSNIDLIKNNYYEPKQNQYNSKDSKKLANWTVAMAVHRDNSKLDKQNIDTSSLIEEFSRDALPEFHKVLDKIISMNIKVLHAFIGAVDPGSYVAPHCDDFYKNVDSYKNTAGVAQFFIPIGWQSGNVFKFANVGNIPTNNGAFLVNNSDYMHGSINQSDSTRYTIGVYCEFTKENLRDLTD